MAAVAGPGLCKNGDRPMSKRLRGPTSSVETGKVPAVRVKLKEVNYQHAIPYPPDGQARECEQWDLRNCCERQLGIHRGRKASGRGRLGGALLRQILTG